jgi:radical SAM-linked protein
MPKYLLTFEKGETVRWLGHLDILRTFERAIRRAALPIAFSNGFNPRERVAFASALSTGVTGAAELAILELTDQQPEALITQQLNTALPSGIRIITCAAIDDAAAKSTLTDYDRVEYEIVCGCPDGTTEAEVEAAITMLLTQEQIPFVREREGKTKTLNLHPHIFALALQPGSLTPNRLTLRMCVGQGESGTVRPHEVVAVLAVTLPGLTARRAHRIRLMKSKPGVRVFGCSGVREEA